MQIKRQFEMTIATRRRLIIRQTGTIETVFCNECGEAMLPAEQAAGFFGITQRRIFQIVETGAAHFTETQTGAAMICLSSLSTVLKSEHREIGK